MLRQRASSLRHHTIGHRQRGPPRNRKAPCVCKNPNSLGLGADSIVPLGKGGIAPHSLQTHDSTPMPYLPRRPILLSPPLQLQNRKSPQTGKTSNAPPFAFAPVPWPRRHAPVFSKASPPGNAWKGKGFPKAAQRGAGIFWPLRLMEMACCAAPAPRALCLSRSLRRGS